jgi:hypothetical protein
MKNTKKEEKILPEPSVYVGSMSQKESKKPGDVPPKRNLEDNDIILNG